MATESKPNNSISPQQSKQFIDDEIDLFELWERLYQQKYLILMIVGFFTLAGLIYSFVATPVYKTSAYLLPPLAKDVQALNINLRSANLFDENLIKEDKTIEQVRSDVFARFLRNIQSRELRRTFFDRLLLTENVFETTDKDVSVLKLFEEKFNEKLILDKPQENSVGAAYVLNLETNDAEVSARWLNDYLGFVIVQTKQELIDEINATIEHRKTELNVMMRLMRENALKQKHDRLEMLNEALNIAKAIDLKSAQQVESPIPRMHYLRGYEAIQAEIETLTQRESEDPFIEKLRELQRYANYLSSFNLEPEAFRVVGIDQQAFAPDEPIQPKKALIIIISVILGAMLGAFIALIRSAVKARYENMSVN